MTEPLETHDKASPATWPAPSPMVWDYRKVVPLGIICLLSVVAISYWLTPAIEEVQLPIRQNSGVVASVPPGQPSPIVERLANEQQPAAGVDPVRTENKDAKIALLERKVNAMAREVQALKNKAEEATPRRRHRKVKGDPPKRRYARPVPSQWWF